MEITMHRRDFLNAGLGASIAALMPTSARTASAASRDVLATLPQRLCVFTDHVDDLGFSYADVAKQYGVLGYGPDLTVRGGGVVPPERVVEELPKAVDAFRTAGVPVPMISTSINDLADPLARPTLKTMHQLGIRYYKLGYIHYHDVAEWQSDLNAAATQLSKLAAAGKELGVTGGIHNHSGASIGGPLWDVPLLLDEVNSPAICSYFDPAHGTLEGANFGWKIGFQRLIGRIGMLAVKDFVWEKSDGGWRSKWCPLGQGLVKWPEFFDMLAKTDFNGPISVHIEFPIAGTTPVERFDNCLAAAQRELEFVRSQLARAYGHA
jgi:L-ribulose-5-phosphate 3-epimerase